MTDPIHTGPESAFDRPVRYSAGALLALTALAMSYGWGFRGDYGHESGAMVPGALVALAAVLASGRPEWYRRAAVIGMFAALGWAFGGQMSYMEHTFYAKSDSFPDVLYAYAMLFVIGGIWAGIGGAVLSFALTYPRSILRRFIGPIVAVAATWILVWAVTMIMGFSEAGRGALQRLFGILDTTFHDSDILQAATAFVAMAIYRFVAPRQRPATSVVLLMAAAWLVGHLILIQWLHLYMAPPNRAENWGGPLFMLLVLLGYHVMKRNRAGVVFTGYSVLAGGLGFVLALLARMPSALQWGPFAHDPAFMGFDDWKWTEQSFGLFMGLGVGLAFLRMLQGGLATPAAGVPGSRLDYFAVFFLLVPMLWLNFKRNFVAWKHGQPGLLPSEQPLFGLPDWFWLLVIATGLAAVVLYGLRRLRRGRLAFLPAGVFGKAQFLFLFILWATNLAAFTQALPVMDDKGIFFVHLTFWLTCIAATLVAFSLPRSGPAPATAPGTPPEDRRWHLGWRYWALWALTPILLLCLTEITLAMSDRPVERGRLRFGPDAYWRTHLDGDDLYKKLQSEGVDPAS